MRRRDELILEFWSYKLFPPAFEAMDTWSTDIFPSFPQYIISLWIFREIPSSRFNTKEAVHTTGIPYHQQTGIARWVEENNT